jgi:hypothetical protein
LESVTKTTSCQRSSTSKFSGWPTSTTKWGKGGVYFSTYKTQKIHHIRRHFHPYKTVSANGATLILAWGNAPGLRQKFTSADGAIHLRIFFGKYGVEFDERYVWD